MTAAAHRGTDADEVRRKRAQLARLLGGIDDLRADWDSTVELARHLRRQRELVGRAADTAAVIADLEIALHGSEPLLPDYKPKPATLEQLTLAIDNAQRAYDDLVRQHVAWATTALDQDQS